MTGLPRIRHGQHIPIPIGRPQVEAFGILGQSAQHASAAARSRLISPFSKRKFVSIGFVMTHSGHGAFAVDAGVAAAGSPSKSTVTPFATIEARSSASQLVKRTQPWDCVLPTRSGSGVP